jgi:uncharacterized protein YjbJ (UPF0337 family)
MSKFKTFILLICCVVYFSFLTFVPNSLANSHSISQQIFSSQSSYLMDFTFPFFKAKAKQLEGKSVELQGKIEGDKAKELQGKMIQTQGELMETTEKTKQVVKETSENISEGVKETSKNISEEIKETSENISAGLKEVSDNISEGVKDLQQQGEKTLSK